MGAFDYKSATTTPPPGVAQNQGKTFMASSALPMNIWSNQSDLIELTGDESISSFTPAPQAGSSRRFLCTGSPKFVYSASMLTQASLDFQAAPGDVIEIIAVTPTTFRVIADRASGMSIGTNLGRLFFAASL